MSDSATVPIYILAALGFVALASFFGARTRALSLSIEGQAAGKFALNSRPSHHGLLNACLSLGGGLAVFVMFSAFRPTGPSILFDAIWGLSSAMMAIVIGVTVTNRLRPETPARDRLDRLGQGGLSLAAMAAVITALAIVLSLLFEALRFFASVPVLDFLFGTQWSPQAVLESEAAGVGGEVEASQIFGALPVFAGTLLVAAIAMVVALPTGLMIAVYLAEYASGRARRIVKPMVEVLAGIPTIVYGVFALAFIGPTIRDVAAIFGANVPAQAAISSGFVLGIMIIPIIASLSDDAIRAVPSSYRVSSLALGATQSETIRHIVLPQARPAIASAVLLAVSRAIGETMIVVLAASRAATLTANPFETVTTVTVQIVALLTGDFEFDSPKTLAAFALGLTLFLLTLALNIWAVRMSRAHAARYAQMAA